ncbi:MAG: hypothetical protein GC137_03040 [Alphaproteobacteria bacterium]|nr:hypothetical protein [Alphaproteobacteria bacterium]
MRIVKIFLACLMLSSCVSLETIDNCTKNVVNLGYCFTIGPVKKVGEYAEKNAPAKKTPPSAEGAKVPKIKKPDSSWGN